MMNGKAMMKAVMNKRQFVCAFAAPAAAFACFGDVSAATHEASVIHQLP
jgi:hypothetical protein